jgi:hypothetical protein
MEAPPRERESGADRQNDWDDGTQTSTRSAHVPQLFADDGHPLRTNRRRLVPGSPRLAQPGWYALAADRWCEA